jgi:hypothetical protein
LRPAAASCRHVASIVANPVYGAGSKYLGRTKKETELRRFHFPTAPRQFPLRPYRGFAWSFLGFVLAAVFGAFALYTEFFRSRSPRLDYDVIANTPVLSTHEDVPALRILYRDIDTRLTHQALSVLAIRIRNDGEANILNSYYDTRDPIGLSVTTGQILEPRVFATTDYLKSNVQWNLSSPSALDFSPMILEPGESFLLRLLILHPDGATPDILPRGKVAGVRHITITHSFQANQSSGLIKSAFVGGLSVQLVRFPSYSIAMIVLLLGVFGSIEGITYVFERGQRRRHLARFRRARGGTISSEGERLLKMYERHGFRALVAMARWLKRDPKLTRAARQLRRVQWASAVSPDELSREMLFRYGSPVAGMLDIGLLRREHDQVVADPDLQSLLRDLIDFLVKNTREREVDTVRRRPPEGPRSEDRRVDP